MAAKDFDIGNALGLGWNIMKANFWFFAGIVLVALLANWIPSQIAESLKETAPFLAFIFRVVGFAVSTIINIGIIQIALKFVAEEKPEFAELFLAFQGRFWRFIGGSILYGLIVVGGLILLVVPGIYWALKFQYFGYLIVDQNCDIMESLKRSSKITEGVKWHLLGFLLLIFLINLGGAFALIIGLFVTMPTTIIAYASVYRKLQMQTEVVTEAQAKSSTDSSPE